MQAMHEELYLISQSVSEQMEVCYWDHYFHLNQLLVLT